MSCWNRLASAAVAVAVAVVILLPPAGALAGDKSGVRPNVISVPSGPGTVAGLGEQFTPHLNTGSATYEVKLEVPPGTAGFEPPLAFSYDSGHGIGNAGIGWTLDVGSIQRQTDKGVPRYADEDRFLLDGQEIVPVAKDVYRLKTEGAFVRIRRTGEFWEVDSPSGVVSRYGVSPGARTRGPAGVFRWALEQMSDVWGNRIIFSYDTDRGQLYLARIEYNARPGAAANEVRLEYEGRLDALTDFRAGFGITLAKRLKRVRMFGAGKQIRRYELDYEPAALQALSRLQSVTMYGNDDKTSLPAVTFGYTGFRPKQEPLQEMPGGPATSLRDPNTELVDVDGDSLPDLLQTTLAGHTVFRNLGPVWGPGSRMATNPSVELGSNGIELADLDGNGLPDLIAKVAPGPADFYYFPNTGRVRWEDRVAFRNNPPFSFEDPGTRLIDIDGDGLVDVMRTTPTAFVYWRNQGGATWSDPWTSPPIPGQEVLFTDPQVKLADLNGDRLLDLAFVGAGAVRYWPSLGHGRWGDTVSLAGAPDAGPDQSRVHLADVNGDGLADLFLVTGRGARIWLQDGAGRLAPPMVVDDLPGYDPTRVSVRLADMNGSGTVDVLWNDLGSSTWRYLDLAGGVRPNLLATIENGLGRRIDITYSSSGAMYQESARAGRAWATRLPFPVQVVANVTTSDGRGWKSSKTFTYADGYFDGASRQFRGFGETTEVEAGSEDEAGAVVVHAFDVGVGDEALKGAEKSIEVRDRGGALHQRRMNGFTARTYAVGLDGRRVAGAERRWTEVHHVEASAAPVTTREDFEYDDFGNVTLHANWGVVRGPDRLAEKDERLTITEYANDHSRWLSGRPVRQTTGEPAAAGARPTIGRKLGELRTYYDGAPFLGLGLGQIGSQGAPNRTEAWVQGDRFVPTERVQRDEFGQVIARLDGRGNRTEIDYDPSHRFAVAERVLLAGARKLEMTASYEETRGLLESYRDTAGRETRFRYGPLSQLTAIYKPGDPEGKPTLSFEYVHGKPLSKVVTRSRTQVGGDEIIEKHHYYDGLGRELGLVEQGDDGKTVVSGLKQFGPQGRIVRELEPFFSQGFDLPADPRGPSTAHAYDVLGRRIRSVLPDGSRSETRHRPLVVEHWDAEDLDPASKHKDTPRTERLNALGVGVVEERLGPQVITTTWHRDGLGRLERVVDADRNEMKLVYDGLGRVIERWHPDAGKTTFGYDEAGNRTWQQDARGARVETPHHDAVNRPLLQRLVDASGREEERVVFHYDAPSPGFPDDEFALGHLTWVEDAAGEEHFRHDDRRRLVESIRRIDGKSYRLGTHFDALDRMVRVTYPSGRSLAYEYGARGFLRAVPGIISQIDYDPEGLVLRREHANGTAVFASYDVMSRTRSLGTRRVAGDGNASLMSWAFDYDRVGNPTSITDNVRATGQRSGTRSFEYDDLYRVRAGTAPERRWSYDFDVLGNYKSKTAADGSRTFAFEMARVHQPASVAGSGIVFDAAGNMIERNGWTQAFDAKGRLKTVTGQDGTVVTYRYDASDLVAVKEISGPKGNHKVVYLDKLAEERDGLLSEYVFAGDKRVARLAPAAAPGGPAVGIVREMDRLPSRMAVLGLLAFCVAGAFVLVRAGARRARAATALGVAAMVLAASCDSASRSPRVPASETAAPDRSSPQAGAVFFHPDYLGGTVLQTDHTGAPQTVMAFDPYGGSLTEAPEPYAFSGKELDASTGLYDFGARAYDPQLGMFISPDPAILAKPEIALGDSHLLNPYSYARNSPTAQVDPDGRLPQILVGAGVGAAFGAGSYLVKAAFTGEFSARGLLASTAGGAVSGAVAAATGGASLLVQGAASGITGGITRRAVETGDISHTLQPAVLVSDAVWGVAGGSVGRGLGSARPPGAGAVAKSGIARSSSPFVPGDPHRGVREASAYLRSQGVPRQFRKEIIDSFEQGTIKVRNAGSAEYRLRYFDGVNASASGRYLFETFPAGRDSLAVRPQWNQMTGIQQWQIRPGTTLIEGRTAGQGPGLSGGQIQTYVNNPKTELIKP